MHMKYYILAVCLISFKFFSFSQENPTNIIEWQKSIGDNWFNKCVDSMIKVGDKVPDLLLGTILNYHEEKNSFADFKGKLVILDFWNTNCSDCIAGFPKMEKLQKEFGDQIQIFLVNVSESKQQIEASFRKRYKNKAAPVLPDLPSIVGPRQDIQRFFPTRGIPHHVWIDKEGIVKISGPSVNTYKQKIEEFLANKKITSIGGSNTAPWFNKEIPYYSLIGKTIEPKSYNSFFSPYNRYYQAWNPGIGENIIDSTNRTVRNSYVNVEVLDLYNAVFKRYLVKNVRNLIYSPRLGSASLCLDWTLLFVTDTLKYTSNIFNSIPGVRQITDQDYIKSRLCYEQITPISMTKEAQMEKMLVDLNDYFGKVYGMTASLEKRTIPCYRLVKTSKEDKLSTKSSNKSYEFKTVTIEGRKMMQMTNVDFRTAIESVFNSMYKSGAKIFVFDETGINNEVDMLLPEPMVAKSIEDVRKVIEPYGLDIVQARREMNFIVFREKNMKLMQRTSSQYDQK